MNIDWIQFMVAATVGALVGFCIVMEPTMWRMYCTRKKGGL